MINGLSSTLDKPFVNKQKNVKEMPKNKSILAVNGGKSYFCISFHGIRFKVSEDWLSRDNQFFYALNLG